MQVEVPANTEQRVRDAVDTLLAKGMPVVSDSSPVDLIVVFGYRLTDDARPRGRLIRRVEVAAELARRYPRAGLLLSGGAPGPARRSEAAVMSDLLVEQGIAAHRLILERYSLTTVENVRYAQQPINDEGFRAAVVVSEEPHLSRAATLLTMTGCLDQVLVPAPRDGELPPAEVAATYRDALQLHAALDIRSR